MACFDDDFFNFMEEDEMKKEVLPVIDDENAEANFE